MPKRVVILGSSGFVGTAVGRHLDVAGLPTVGVGSAQIDLSRRESGAALAALLREGDAVVFLSAVTREKGRDVGTFMTNVAMGATVCAALDRRVTQLVYVSSDAIYGDDALDPISESTPTMPTCLYGIMHLVRERMLEHAAAAADIPFVVLRPSIIYGAGDTHSSYGPNRFLRTARRFGTVTLFGGGEELRDHVYIDDLARIITGCLTSRRTGVLNVATGTAVTFAAIARIMQRLSATPLRIQQEARAVPIVHRRFDVSALQAAFPGLTMTSVEDGLEKTWDTVRSASPNAASS